MPDPRPRSPRLDFPAAPPRTPPDERPSTPAEVSRPWYRAEPWLATLFASLVLVGAAAFLPRPAKPLLIGLGLAAFLLGVALLVRQETRPQGGASRRIGD